jgi:hypothetical protein
MSLPILLTCCTWAAHAAPAVTERWQSVQLALEPWRRAYAGNETFFRPALDKVCAPARVNVSAQLAPAGARGARRCAGWAGDNRGAPPLARRRPRL